MLSPLSSQLQPVLSSRRRAADVLPPEGWAMYLRPDGLPVGNAGDPIEVWNSVPGSSVLVPSVISQNGSNRPTLGRVNNTPVSLWNGDGHLYVPPPIPIPVGQPYTIMVAQQSAPGGDFIIVGGFQLLRIDSSGGLHTYYNPPITEIGGPPLAPRTEASVAGIRRDAQNNIVFAQMSATGGYQTYDTHTKLLGDLSLREIGSGYNIIGFEGTLWAVLFYLRDLSDSEFADAAGALLRLEL